MKENKFQKNVIKQLESQGVWILNIHGHRMQKSGIPDLHVVHRKWSGYLELKCEKNTPSPLQKDKARKINNRWYPCYVLRCVENHPESNIPYWYAIENFNGDELIGFCDLKLLLDHLIELKNEQEWLRSSSPK